MVLGIGERLRRGDDDGLAGVDTHRVDIFHVAYRDAIVERIADDLVFDLFPAAQIFFDQDLRCDAKSFGRSLSEFFSIAYDARTFTTKREPRAHHDGETDLFCCSECLLRRTCRLTPRGLHTYFGELAHK